MKSWSEKNERWTVDMGSEGTAFRFSSSKEPILEVYLDTPGGSASAGHLKVVWPEIFGPVFPGFPAETDPRDPPRSPGPAPHVKRHEKSAPQTNFKAKWRRLKNSARLPSGIQRGGRFARPSMWGAFVMYEADDAVARP